MSMTLEAPQVERADSEVDICHLACLDCYPPGSVPLLAVCGHDCTDEPMFPDDFSVLNCVLCEDVHWCPSCGQLVVFP